MIFKAVVFKIFKAIFIKNMENKDNNNNNNNKIEPRVGAIGTFKRRKQRLRDQSKSDLIGDDFPCYMRKIHWT